MNIIEIHPLSNGAHRNQNGCNSCPDGWAVVPDDIETPNFPFGTFDVDMIDGVPTLKNWVAGIMPEPVEPSLSDVQGQRIAESKTALAEYLESHPLTWTDGKQYSVTEDKQALLTGNLAAYQLAVTLGQENPELTWNATGEECTVWTFENLAMLAIAIKAYVKPLVAYQQKTEIEIRACTTAEDVEAVAIDYEAAS